VTWEHVAYSSLTSGFVALCACGYFLHRVCQRLSSAHPETHRRLGQPAIHIPGRWSSKALKSFLGSREYIALDDPELTGPCRRLQLGVRIAATFAAIAFIAVFAEAFARAA
jgi:hypothetical protein